LLFPYFFLYDSGHSHFPKEKMFGKRIIIIGGSIAGCTAAILLRRLGATVTILERSAGRIGAGSGISLPESIVKRCFARDLFDSDIPSLPLNARVFVRKNESGSSDQDPFWTQALRVIAFNWADVYQNLRKRIDPQTYYTNTELRDIKHNEHGYVVQTSTGKYLEADLVIAADGVDSATRQQILPSVQPEYMGYIAWRGLIYEKDLIEEPIFDEQTPYYVFPNGHLLLYRVPGLEYHQNGQIILSWTLYENRQGLNLKDFLIDNQGKIHTRSLPAGSLTPDHIDYLHALAQRVLPSSVVKYITKTPQPFIQAIFDCQTPNYASNHIIFMGDAALTLRPHSGSGVFKALANGLDLIELIEKNSDKTLKDYVSMWKSQQAISAAEDIPKAQRMGEALVTNSPNWKLMKPESMKPWWKEVMQGRFWHATPTFLEETQ
jgi:2-polyprenyl-6-methoxyphenol hydroxylase-like FAD-dependent oxidoreductase